MIADPSTRQVVTLLCAKSDEPEAVREVRPADVALMPIGPGDELLREILAGGSEARFVIFLTRSLADIVWPRRAFEVAARELGTRICAVELGLEPAWVRRHAPSLQVTESVEAAVERVLRPFAIAPGVVSGP